MERIFNQFSALFQSLLSLLKIIIRSKYSIKIPQAKVENCLILGNGPSVKDDLDLISMRRPNIDVLCLNKFPDTGYFERIKPEHFVIVSTEFWNKGSIQEYNEVRDNIIVAIINKTKWPLNVFIPAEARKHKWFIDQLKENKDLNIVFYNTTPIEGNAVISNFFFNMKLGMPRPHNVLIPSILNSLWMGYNNIGVVGADHSWLETLSVSEKNEALLNQKHFYDDDKNESRKMTKKGSSFRKLHEILEKFMLTFKAYFILDDFAKSRNQNLYNCSSKSYIDGLERMPLKDFLKK